MNADVLAMENYETTILRVLAGPPVPTEELYQLWQRALQCSMDVTRNVKVEMGRSSNAVAIAKVLRRQSSLLRVSQQLHRIILSKRHGINLDQVS